MNIRFLFKGQSTLIAIVLTVFIAIGPSTVQSQECSDNTVQLILPDTITAMPGDQFCIDVSVNNFNDIVLFFFVVNFNSTVLQFDSVDPTVSGLTGFTVGDVTPPRPTDPDIIRVLWSHPNLTASNLPDGSLLMEVCFTVIGTPGVNGQILFNNAGLGSPAEFLDSDNNSFLPCNPNPGSGFIEIIPAPSDEPQVFITGQCGSEMGSEGRLELKVFYGDLPYTLSDDQGNVIIGDVDQSTFLLQDLPVGSRTYTITDANGRVSAALDVTITNDPAFSIETIREKAPNCPTDSDGLIQLDVAGGKPFANGEYFYDWGTNQIGLGQSELKDLSNGSYTVTISDSLGCRQSATYDLLRSEIEVSLIESVPSLCEGRNNGILRVEASGGGPYRNGYTWVLEREENGSIIPVGTISDPTFNPEFRVLPAGLYRITARDSVDRRQNCSVQAAFEVSVARELTAQVVSTDPMGCTNGEESSILEIVSSNGDLDFPINVQLTDTLGNSIYDDVVNASTVNIPCIPNGLYTIRINDSQGCANTSEIRIQANTITIADSTIVNPSCQGTMDGYIALEVASDNPPLNFMWSTGEMGEGVDSIGGLVEGPYQVTITDAVGSEAIFEFVLAPAIPFTIDVEIDEAILCPNGTGNIIAIPTGGSGDVSYTWNPDDNAVMGSVLADIPAGTYTVIASDSNGCTDTDSTVISGPTPPTFNLSNVLPPSCAGENTGTAVLSVQQNIDFPGPFFFESSTGLRGSNNNFTVDNFPAGMGTDNWIVFGDANCVFDTVYIDIPEVQPFSIDRVNTTISEIDCFGDSGNDGAIVNLAANGPNNIQFAWPDINQTGPVQLNLSAGTYSVILSVGTCTAVDSIVITQPDSLSVQIDSLSSIFALCGGDNSTELVLDVNGGTVANDYSYEWLDDDSGVTVSTSDRLTNASNGTYTFTVTDDNGCEAILNAEVQEPSEIVATIGDIQDPLCMNEQGYITIDTAIGGIGAPYRYQVNTSLTMSIQDTSVVIPGDLTVRVFDQNGCSWDTVVTILPPPTLSISLGPDDNIELGESVSLTATVNSQSSIDTIIWTPDTNIQCEDSACLTVTSMPVTTTTYVATAIDINGCMVSDDIMIDVARTSNIYIPNAFSPEAVSPGNRIFKVFTGTGVAQIDYIRVYDRWGNKVHAEETPQPRQLSGVGTWNGNLNNDPNKRLEAGTYIYVVQFSFLDGGAPEIRKGNVTLIR